MPVVGPPAERTAAARIIRNAAHCPGQVRGSTGVSAVKESAAPPAPGQSKVAGSGVLPS